MVNFRDRLRALRLKPFDDMRTRNHLWKYTEEELEAFKEFSKLQEEVLRIHPPQWIYPPLKVSMSETIPGVVKPHLRAPRPAPITWLSTVIIKVSL